MTSRLRIGLTGGIASGKSTAAQRFEELGVPVIDADQVAHALVARGQPAHAAVLARFPGIPLLPNGDLNRRALRDHVFADPLARRDLEAILHPLIRAEMQRLAAAVHGPYVVLAIPLLVESSRQSFDRVLVIDADEDLQLRRLLARDGGTEAQAHAILNAQATRAKRLSVADDVLVNSGSVSDLRQAVDDLHVRYLERASKF